MRGNLSLKCPSVTMQVDSNNLNYAIDLTMYLSLTLTIKDRDINVLETAI